MPMIWTHLQFCEDVIDRTEKLYNLPLNEHYLTLGSQGDNLLSFHPPWLKKQVTNKKVSSDLIAKNSEDNFISLIKKTPINNKNVISYIIGYITYCFLENKLKDYLNFYRSSTHVNINSVIDTLFMEKHYNLHTWKIPVYKELNLGLKVDSHIKPVLHIINPYLANNLQRAYIYSQLSLQWLFDPYGWKTKVLPYYTPIYSKHIQTYRGFDFLNENKAVWNLSTQDQRSFIELYTDTIIEVTHFISHLIAYWETKDEEKLNIALNLLRELNKS